MMETSTTLFETIRKTYEAHGITVTDIAKRHIRKHVFCHRAMLEELAASGVTNATLPPMAAFSFRDISAAELKDVVKDLSIEFGAILTILPRNYSGLPFFEVLLNWANRKRRNNNDNS